MVCTQDMYNFQEQQKQQQARRENQVTLYRKYRIGDFPDIQIKHQCLIAPLQALANRDSTVANLLFRSLFRAIFSQMDQVKTEREIDELTQQINQSIETILSQSVLYYPPFIGCILTILYELRSNLKVSASPLALGAAVSSQQILGILVLEEQLIQTDTRQATDSSKRPRLARENVSQNTSLWIELSRLYKSIGEFDVLQGIFSDKLGTKDITRRAIEAEARGDYKAASKLYDQAMRTQEWPDLDPQEAEVDFWEGSRMECLDYLTQWKDLDSIATRGIDDSPTPNLDRVWEDGFYQELYLPYLMRSKLKLLLTEADDSDPSGGQPGFLNFLTNALKDEQKRQHLQSRYCKELALLFLWQGNYDTARHYTSLAFESFLQSWSSTTTLMESSRRENLQSLQGLIEQQEFLDHTASLERAGSLSTSKLTRQWQGRSPHPLLDPVVTWDDVVTNRNLFLSRLAEKIKSSGAANAVESQDSELVGETGEQKLAEMSVSLFLAMAHSCRLQNNFSVTLKIMKKTESTCRKLDDQEQYIKWVHLYTQTHQFKVRNSQQWTDTMLSDLCTTLDQLGKVEENPALLCRAHLGLSQRVLTGHSLDLLASGLLSATEVSPTIKAKLASHANLKHSNISNEQIVASLIQKGYRVLKASASAADIISQNEEHQDLKVMTCELVYLEFAKFCDKYLHLKEDDALPETCDVSAFPVTVVTCLLRAMKGGVIEARQRFPRLLQIAELYPDVKSFFIDKASEIPSWMFLLWVSQMTALLDKPEAVVVSPLLLRIAKEYPQAFIYPFRMSSEGYNFGTTAQDKKNQAVCQELETLCSNPEVNKFISALEQFGQPDMIFKDWCGDMRKLVAHKNKSKVEIKKKFQEVVVQLFDVKSAASVDTTSTQASFMSTASSVPMGDYRKGFAVALKDLFFKTFGQDGDKLSSMNSKEFSSAEAKITNSINNLQGQRGNKLKPPTKIKDYCPWMSDFNPSKSGDLLEIP
ncbi:DNA-dependent protein kinase catalytic subunit, partial [Elysia marginata]